MKGLMLKEFYEIRRYSKTFLLYLVIFGGMGIFTGSASMYGVMSAVFMTSIPLSSFTMDEASRWEGFALSAPISRRQLVGAKYRLVVVCTVFSAISSVIIVALGALLRPEMTDMAAGMVATASIIATVWLMMMLLLPILFKVGATKGRMLLMMIFGGTFVAMLLGTMLVAKLGLLSGSPAMPVVGVLLAAVVVLAAFAFGSYSLSCALYAKREF